MFGFKKSVFGVFGVFGVLAGAAAIAGAAFFLSMSSQIASAEAPETIPNELIDYPTFREIVAKAEAPRELSRLTESNFLAAMKEPGTVLLDARSAEAFELRHISGARNLPYTDWTEAALAEVIPTKDTRVLIYCNNNFRGSQRSFATKAAPASLNLLSYTSLVAYGYTNINELGPLLSIHETVLPFSGTEVETVADVG